MVVALGGGAGYSHSSLESPLESPVLPPLTVLKPLCFSFSPIDSPRTRTLQWLPLQVGHGAGRPPDDLLYLFCVARWQAGLTVHPRDLSSLFCTSCHGGRGPLYVYGPPELYGSSRVSGRLSPLLQHRMAVVRSLDVS